MSERFDVVVVGSGAGGGVVAGELAECGRRVLLLECGPHRTAADFTRWEAKATHELWWPIRFALIDGGAGGAVALLGGRCVGGTTTVNTKVALRAHAEGPRQVARGERARRRRRRAVRRRPTSSRTTTGSRRASACASGPTGRRACARSSPRFRALGCASSSRCMSYTDAQLHELRLVPAGLPDERGQVDAQHVHPRRLGGGPARAARRRARRARRDRGRRGDGRRVRRAGRNASRASTRAWSSSPAGTLNTPQLLLRSGLPDSPSSRLIGRNLGFHPARLVYGLFDEPQDAHMVYPITAHAMGHQHDEDGGFVIEATTIQDPIGFATTLEDENGPLWGDALVEALRGFRRWIGLLVDGERRQQRQRARRRERRRVVRGGVRRRRARAHRRRARLHARRCSSAPAPRPSAGPG